MTDTQNSYSTLLSLTNRVRRALGENFSEFWQDSTIHDHINDAIMDISRQGDFPYEQDTYTVTTEVGTDEYDQPPNLKKILSVREGSDSNPIIYLTPEQFDSGDFDVGGYFTIYAGKLRFSGTAPKTYTLRILKYPEKLVENSDQTIIPPEYDEAIIHYTVARAREQEEEYDQAKLKDQKYQEIVDKMKVDRSKFVSQKTSGFTPMSGYANA